MIAPLRRLQRARMPSLVTSTSAPRASRVCTWKSTGRRPMRSPPTMGTNASPVRCSSGPSSSTGIRLSPLNESGTSDLASSGGVISSWPSDRVDAGADRPQDPRGDLDVAHVGDVGDRARPLAQDGGDHVLGNGVLGAVNLHVADERAVGLYEPCV